MSIPLDGYLNSIALGPRGRFAVVAKGQEHRLGRWNPVQGATNRLAIVKLFTERSGGAHADRDTDTGADQEEDQEQDVISSSSNDEE